MSVHRSALLCVVVVRSHSAPGSAPGPEQRQPELGAGDCLLLERHPGHGSVDLGGLGGDDLGTVLSADKAPVSPWAQLLAEDRPALLARRPLDAWAVACGDFGRLLEPVEDVPRLNVGAGSGSDCLLASEDANRFAQGLVRGHGRIRFSKLVCMIGANTLARKTGKIPCMNSLGDLVKAWREGSGITTRELADLVGHKVKRQHIEQLEAVGDRLPRYLPHLAAAMGTTTDALLKLQMPPLLGSPVEPVSPAPVTLAPPPKPAPGFKDPQRDTGWQVLQDLEDLHPTDKAEWVASLHRLAEKSREIGRIHADKVMLPIKAKAKKT